MNADSHIRLGVKSDPIEYRYSFDWLFRIMAEEGVDALQVGSIFEMYQLEDGYFSGLRKRAEAYGIRIESLFTAHRELGGFFLCDPYWERVARRNYERYIEVGALLGARHVGSNPGAVLRDCMEDKVEGTACYLRNMKELMHYAHARGIACLTMEPMSCLAEPPTLPEEIKAMAEELAEYHAAHGGTVPVRYCADTSHGYADAQKRVVHTPLAQFEATLPWLGEFHVKNTDGIFGSTFGFTAAERERGIVDLAAVRDLLAARRDVIPEQDLVAYLEIGGPKTGRDYSDGCLEEALRSSLAHMKEVFCPDSPVKAAPLPVEIGPAPAQLTAGRVQIAPSLMCCDLCHFEDSVRALERAGADLLHIDLMDAHFTPNMPLGLEILKQLRPRTALPFDAHLMVNLNDFFVRQMAEIGAQMVSIHVESSVHLDRSLGLIRDLGMKAGAALNPATPLRALEYVIGRLDFVLLMTVNPGFAGQALVPSGLAKIAACRKFLDERGGEKIPIEVDGNVSFAHIPRMVAAGADILVAGTSSVFHAGASPGVNMAKTRAAIEEGLAGRVPHSGQG